MYSYTLSNKTVSLTDLCPRREWVHTQLREYAFPADDAGDSTCEMFTVMQVKK